MTAFLLHTAAFVVAIEVARRIAIRRSYLSHPNPIVASHRSPVAYLGGTGLGIAFLMLLGLHWSAAPHLIDLSVLARAAAALAFIALGTWDDLHPLRARSKFLAQVAIAAAYLAASGTSMMHADGWLSLLVLMTLINAYNLVDVLDGLLTVLAAIAVTALLLLPTTGQSPAVDLEVRLAIAGLAAIFLFNCPPARIYHGDAGSLTLGFLIGAWGLERAAGLPLAERASLLGLAAVPLLELMILIPARIRRGLSPFAGSPDHFALRLQDTLRWGRWRVLTASAAAGIFFAAVPFASSRTGTLFVTYTAAALLAALGLWWAVWRIPPRASGPRCAAPATPRVVR